MQHWTFFFIFFFFFFFFCGAGGGGVFYRCEEYAWLLYEIWLRAYFSHTWDILVWNPWRIGTNSSALWGIGTNFSRRDIYNVWNLRFNNATLSCQDSLGFTWLVNNTQMSKWYRLLHLTINNKHTYRKLFCLQIRISTEFVPGGND